MPWRDARFRCPHCAAALARYDARDKWRCKACLGTLVGATELKLELGALGAHLGDPAISLLPGGWQTKGCPGCGDTMTPINLGPLTLDRCDREQLLWFDRGELGRVRTDLGEGCDPWVQRLVEATWVFDVLDEEEDVEAADVEEADVEEDELDDD